jgi:NAD(P)-dependent dehydrogenase (short-subunit alcohol dehydrogenase family)
MARIFITGSADGLGQLASNLLIRHGHQVVLHARDAERGRDALKNAPGAETVLTGDLSSIDETKKLADEVNASGVFDAVIHNAGVYQRSSKQIFTVNTLAPYLLTCLMRKPQRLIYLSSGLHLQGRVYLDSMNPEGGSISYSDSKLHVLILAKEVARRWPDVYANAVDPGWVPTKMGGQGAPDDLQKGYETQAWLAVSDDDNAKVSGHYFYHQKQKRSNPEADNAVLRGKFIARCQEITGVSFPVRH